MDIWPLCNFSTEESIIVVIKIVIKTQRHKRLETMVINNVSTKVTPRK